MYQQKRRMASNDINPDYHQRINKVLNYLQENLSNKLSLQELASIGSFSPFHFHRLMRAYLSEPLGTYLKRLRLEKAARLLLFTDNPITEISERIGYETPSSFTAAFHKQFGFSPKDYRLNKAQPDTPKAMKDNPRINFDFEPLIQILPPLKLAFVRVFGPYESSSIGEGWGKIMRFATQHELLDAQTKRIGISYDDPEVSSTENYQYQACISIDKAVKAEGEVSTKELPGGKYAVFTYRGSYEGFDTVYNLIFKEWLLKSPCQLRDAEIFDLYIDTPEDNDPQNYITQIHIPIQ